MPMSRNLPILEFDNSRRAIIEPRKAIKPIDAPEHCVVCFFAEVINKLAQEHKAKVIARQKSAMGTHPLFELDVEGKRLAVFHPGVGAPLAAALLEEVIARGCRKFIACGAAGVLDRDIAVGHVIVPVAAVRDEGTSYHYLAAAHEVRASAKGVAAIKRVLRKHSVDYIVSKTWTTDAFYRETPAKVKRRRAEGCLTVEMEAAAFFAVAKFRRVVFAQMLCGGDDVSGGPWDTRGWYKQGSVRENLFWLAAEACLSL